MIVNFDRVLWGHRIKTPLSLRVYAPVTNADRTISWFMFGNTYINPPDHINCRCVVVNMDDCVEDSRNAQLKFFIEQTPK